ncbi:hypothetical protein [Streptomyces sp. NPDC001851]|uniref:hypothetical protein n=1 Tax=Streptomyces sp. NPDC001851 TaxID=3154529 RepID=UPI003330AFDE
MAAGPFSQRSPESRGAVDGTPQAAGVQDAGEVVLAGIGMADGVGQHGRDTQLVDEGRGAGGQAQ